VVNYQKRNNNIHRAVGRFLIQHLQECDPGVRDLGDGDDMGQDAFGTELKIHFFDAGPVDNFFKILIQFIHRFQLTVRKKSLQ
jgi:hypothetical protein